MSSIAGKISKFTKSEIAYLFQHARRVFKSSACVILKTRRQRDFSRILIVISRKVGSAPERNKLRRQIKSIFYQQRLFNSSFDYVCILYKPAVQLAFNDIKQILLRVYEETQSSAA